MTVSTHKKYWTDEALLALTDEGKCEIVDGELIVSPAATSSHGSVIMRIMIPLANYVLANNLGEVLEGQSGSRMLNGDLFAPDISFIVLARWRPHKQAGVPFFPGAPDLIVEVLSPSDRKSVLQKKLTRCFQNGTRLAWVVDPRKRTVQVYHSPAPDKILTIDDALDGENIVPGFTLPLRQVFV